MLTPDQIDDLATITLSKFKRIKFTNISRDYQHLTVSRLINEKKVRESGGKDIRFFLKTGTTGNARPSGIFDPDQTSIAPLMTEANVPWRQLTTNYSYSVYEDSFQSSEETLIEQLKVREIDALEDMMELLEVHFWTAPTSPTENRLWGLPLWIQKDTTTTGSFAGGNPSGFSSGLAGIDTGAHANWRNWAGSYTDVSISDLVKGIKKAMRRTLFKNYVQQPELSYGSSKQCEMFTTETVVDQLERIAEQRNDNLGKDVALYMNEVMIGGCPISWVPYLDANDTSAPVYGVNWSKFRPHVKKGWDMTRQGPKVAPLQHDTRTVHIDHWMNYVCTDRRAQWVLSKAS